MNAMQPTNVMQGRERELPAGAQPYPRSWFDSLLLALTRLGVWGWVILVLLALAQFLYVNVMFWMSGTLPPGTFEFRRTFFVVLISYVLGVWVYLLRVAREAFARFRPVLDMDDTQAARLEYELTTQGPREAWLGAGFGVLIFVGFYATISRHLIMDYGPDFQTVLLQFGWLQLLVFLIGGVGLARGLRQLRMVTRIHAQATRINLFHALPLYAFSSLTAQIAISFALYEYYLFVTRPDMLLENPAVIVFAIISVPLAAACFVLPLREMHQRIVREKARLLGAANERFERLVGRVHRAVDADEFQEMEPWNKALQNLVIERDTLEKIPTWPWERGTLTGFLTALLLPIVLWLITRFLGRVI